jgi:type IV secretory pathway TraG/TraD family ATPase VirD4
MTQAWHIVQEMLDALSLGLSRLAAFFGTQKHLHTDRFATTHEVKHLAHNTSYGLVLGLDRFGRLLTVAATKTRPHLGHLAIFGPTGSGKTTREEEQLRRWQGSAIVNDPKFQLSHSTAELRRKFGKVYFFSPSEGTGDSYDPLDGIESERKLYSLAKQKPRQHILDAYAELSRLTRGSMVPVHHAVIQCIVSRSRISYSQLFSHF